jgi:hypothetical protein
MTTLCFQYYVKCKRNYHKYTRRNSTWKLTVWESKYCTYVSKRRKYNEMTTLATCSVLCNVDNGTTVLAAAHAGIEGLIQPRVWMLVCDSQQHLSAFISLSMKISVFWNAAPCTFHRSSPTFERYFLLSSSLRPEDIHLHTHSHEVNIYLTPRSQIRSRSRQESKVTLFPINTHRDDDGGGKYL